MADITYKCPKCTATLKPGRPIPAGKKIKCPKCENIFAPDGETKEKVAASKPESGRPKPDDEEGGGMYGFKDEPAPPEPKVSLPVDADEDEDEDKPRKKKSPAKGAIEEALIDKAPKRKKGAAQAICQGPSNLLLATSSFACASCIISVLTALWPLLFSTKKPATVPTELDIIAKVGLWVIVLLIVAAFVYNGFIAVGAVKMQSMESYTWGIVASILILLPFNCLLLGPTLYWLLRLIDSLVGKGSGLDVGVILLGTVWYVYVGVRNLITLRREDVRAGFAEQAPSEIG